MCKIGLATLLGGRDWSRLESLAEYHGEADIKEFARRLFDHAISESEIWMHAERFKKYEQLIDDLEMSERLNWEKVLAERSEDDGICDDDIPF